MMKEDKERRSRQRHYSPEDRERSAYLESVCGTMMVNTTILMDAISGLRHTTKKGSVSHSTQCMGEVGI